MKEVKIEYIEEQASVTVEGEVIAIATNEMTKAVVENLLVSLEQAGAINLSIENSTK